MKEMNWKLEAKKQAALAGELKFKIAERLADITARKENTKRQMEATEDNAEQAMLNWKLGQLEEQEQWLEAALKPKGKERR